MTSFASTVRNQLAAAGLRAFASSSRIAGINALLLGLFVVYGVGFAGAEVMHNMAHDGRHSIAFPCH